MSDITLILDAASAGDKKAAAELLPLVYEELRKLATSRMSEESPNQTLQATALVHEAYLQLIGPEDEVRWANRAHFFAAAADAMRRILVDRARRKQTQKHGGHHVRVELTEVSASSDTDGGQLIALNEALTRLAVHDPVAARLVELRYFAGMSMADAATALELSQASAYRHWTYARAWLQASIAGTSAD